MEIHTNQEFYAKIGYIIIEMSKLKKSEGQLENGSSLRKLAI
jgi:hypothetical protein